MLRYLILVFISIKITFSSSAQLSAFVYDIKKSSGLIDFDKIVSLLRIDTNRQTMLLLSEDRHDFLSLRNAKTDLISTLKKYISIDGVYLEMSAIDFTLYRGYFDKKIDIDSILKKSSPFYNIYVTDDYKAVEKNNYNIYFSKLQSGEFLNRIVPLDIGVFLTHLSIFYYAEYTKSINTEGNSVIDNFCDSIRQNYAVEYHAILETWNDTDNQFQRKDMRIREFLEALKSNSKYATVYNAWQSAFASYYRTRYNMKHFPGLRRFDARPIDNSKLHSFRDSILYVNFEYFKKMNSSWNNTIFSFSTYHLLDTRDRSLFSEVLDPATHTLGRFLHSRYDSSIVHIAFVCNSGLIKDKVSNNKNYKKSLEYQLSKTHDFAYIDLAAYRKSPNEKKAFYLRPTFEKFILTNWEDILDGIIFIKDCQCQNP